MPEHDLQPWCRATIAGGKVTLNPWAPSLVRGGPAAMVLRDLAGRGIALADLHAEGEPLEEELLVRYVADTRTTEADEALVRWAHVTGYVRIWLPGRVVELEPATAPCGPAATTCPTCGLRWHDGTPEFWAGVRRAGAFPAFCVACGGSLPEWEPEDAESGERVSAGRQPCGRSIRALP